MSVEVWVDVLCPWSYIAERRLAIAAGLLEERSRVEIVWRSYELGPDLSREPGPTAADEMRGGDWWGDQAEARMARIQELGAAEGVRLNLEKARPVNSFDAHRLVHLGAHHRRADEVLEGLLRAYHTEGRNIADPSVLRDVGVAAGLADSDVDSVLAGDAYATAVRADERRAVELAVTGVPTIVVAERLPVAGVQPVAVLRGLLEESLDAEPHGRGEPSLTVRDSRPTA